MDAVIGSVRAHLFSHPLALLLFLLVWSRLGASARSPHPRLTIAFGATALLSYLAIVIWYVLEPQYFDHAEPSIAAVSWLAVNGGALYHSPGAEVCYAHPYGPLLYLTNGAAMWLTGP